MLFNFCLANSIKFVIKARISQNPDYQLLSKEHLLQITLNSIIATILPFLSIKCVKYVKQAFRSAIKSSQAK